jgi:hypothetical protein
VDHPSAHRAAIDGDGGFVLPRQAVTRLPAKHVRSVSQRRLNFGNVHLAPAPEAFGRRESLIIMGYFKRGAFEGPFY